MSDHYEQVEVTSRAAWRAWLERHHASSPGIWLVTYKKATAPDRYLPYDDIVDEAIAFGWVDSLPRTLDERRSMLLLTRRTRGSSWSRVNRTRAERIIASGRMTPAGQAAIDAAKADGSWTRLDDVENLVEPDDLRAALEAAGSRARQEWDGFPRSTRRAILEWILDAKRPETRARRVTETAEKAAAGIRANQWRQPKGR